MSKKLLRRLLLEPEKLDDDQIPVLAWLRETDKSIERTIVPYTGNLSIYERAQIANWFERHVSIDKSIRRHWIGLAPFGHAITLFIASRLRNAANDLDMEDEANLLKQAWEMQATDVEELWYAVDIGKECLERLEEEMFEESERAGIAGHRQWGLDAGDHQDGWDPYLGTPEHWNYEDRAGSDSELQVSRLQLFID